jgi:Mn-containing catalase
MYHHVKEWMYTVHVDTPHPRFGNVLVEQFGGPNGELAAALQYAVQGLNNSMGLYLDRRLSENQRSTRGGPS